MAHLYSSDELVTSPAGSDRILVLGRLERRAHFTSLEDVALLVACREPRTIEAQVDYVRASLGATLSPEWVRQRLQHLVSAGLLISARDLTKIWSSGVSRESPRAQRRIETCGVPSRLRQTALPRMLHGFCDNAHRHGRSLSVIIVHDADEVPAFIANRRWPAQLVFIGDRSRSRYAGVPLHILRFGLCGSDITGTRVGAARNCLLLASGGPMVMVDDDVSCVLRRWRHARESLVVAANNDLTEFIQRASAEAASDFLTASDSDFFGLHEQYLGRDVVDFVRSSAGGEVKPDTSRLTAAWIRAAIRDGARIECTLSGITGDLGTDSPCPWLSGRSEVRDPGNYSEVRLSRFGVRLAPVVAVTRPVLCQTYAFGIDASLSSIPFAPNGSNEDGLFATLLSALGATTSFCYLPVAVTHMPVERRAFTEYSVKTPVLTVGSFLAALVAGVHMDESLLQFQHGAWPGRYLSSLGSSAWCTFEDVVITALVRQWAAEMAALSDELCGRSSPDPIWERDLTARIGLLEEHIRLRRIPQFADCPQLGGRSDVARRQLQQFVTDFGTLLSAWPDIRDAAAGLELQSLADVATCEG